jgi:hypothetical protein
MNTKIPVFLASAFAILSALGAAEPGKPASRVEVVFIQPEKFTDCRDEHLDTGRSREPILAQIRTTMEKLGERYLPAGNRLEIRVTNIDLAGEFEPWHQTFNEDIRFVRDIYPPRIELEFRLLDSDGKVIREDKCRLQDNGFLMSGSFPDTDALRYEKEMLRTWMVREFKRRS